MKTLHFYCNTEKFGPFDEPQPDNMPQCALTPGFVDFVLRACASGKAPFSMTIPRSIAFYGDAWKTDPRIVTVTFVEGKPDTNSDPVDFAVIMFDDCTAIIHARRALRHSIDPT